MRKITEWFFICSGFYLFCEEHGMKITLLHSTLECSPWGTIRGLDRFTYRDDCFDLVSTSIKAMSLKVPVFNDLSGSERSEEQESVEWR